MKQFKIKAPNDIRLLEVPTPNPGPHEVLVKIVRSGICGTDYAIYTGNTFLVTSGAVKYPLTPGHEWSGIVDSIGSEVNSFVPGDRVVGDTGVSCGNCNKCLIGDYYSCKNFRAVGTVNAWDGAYAEYILMPERHLFYLPDNVGFDNGAMIECAATALYSVYKAEVMTGDTVLVHGTGPIGIIAGKLAKICGASKVVITGRKEFKLNKSLEFGMDGVINTTTESLPDAIGNHFGREGVDKIIEASGSAFLFNESIRLINPGGIVSCVAFYEKGILEFNLDRCVLNNITIRGVGGSLGMYPRILRLMASGILDCTPLITSRIPLMEAAGALSDMEGNNEKRIKIMLEQDN